MRRFRLSTLYRVLWPLQGPSQLRLRPFPPPPTEHPGPAYMPQHHYLRTQSPNLQPSPNSPRTWSRPLAQVAFGMTWPVFPSPRRLHSQLIQYTDNLQHSRLQHLRTPLRRLLCLSQAKAIRRTRFYEQYRPSSSSLSSNRSKPSFHPQLRATRSNSVRLSNPHSSRNTRPSVSLQ